MPKLLQIALWLLTCLCASQTLEAVVGSTADAPEFSVTSGVGDLSATGAKAGITRGFDAKPQRATERRERKTARVSKGHGVPRDESDKRLMSVGSLVLGVLGVAFLFFIGPLGVFALGLSLIASVLAVVFGFTSMRRRREGYLVNRGMAIAGTILGFVGIAALALLALVIIALAAAF